MDYEINIKMSGHDNPERIFTCYEAIWYDVMILAVKDLKFPTEDENCSFKWFMSNRESLGSFLWICFMLDLAPDCIFRGLADRLVRHIKVT